MQIIATLVRYQRATNRVTDQRGYADDCKHGACPHPDLSNIRNLCDQGRSERYEGAAGKAVECGEEDIGNVAASGKPETEDKDGAEERGYKHHIEASDFVGNVTWDGPAEDGD